MKTIDIDLTPEEYHDESLCKERISKQTGIDADEIAHIHVVRRSLDSRRGIRYHTNLELFLTDEPYAPPHYGSTYLDCRQSPAVVIVGAGPAGLFAALTALEKGFRPIIVERGKEVGQRKLDIAALTRRQIVNPDSNWCFGEGGAGTFSDGKLFTRSTKRGNVGNVLNKFIEHGADPDILVDLHAHIGTDRLSGIIANIRNTILAHGGEYHFNTKVTDFVFHNDGSHRSIRGVKCDDGSQYEGLAVVLATGHSARDIYELFHAKGWLLEAKPFALGVRVEHPQALINQIQYHGPHFSPLLPPASYSLTSQVNGHGVFSFCMCPGGYIVPAATDLGQQVVNGMSNSHRNSPFANSGIAVTVAPEDVPQFAPHGPLALLRFQQSVEQSVYAAAGNTITAPAQRLTDFCEDRLSQSLNKSNYMGQCLSAPLHRILPPFIVGCLQQGFRLFDKKMHGFYTQNANILAVESRTSSPVRIPRGDDMQHPQLKRLYPCGEGAGYAGGIVSSAIDGINCILHLADSCTRH